MSRVTFTKDDILKSKLVPPNWYSIVVKSYEQQQAGTDGSDLHVFSLIIDGGDYAGVPIRLQGSEKFYTSEFIEFVEICNNGIQPGVPVEFDKFVGKKLDGFVQRGEYKQRPQNQFVNFRKAKEGARA